MHDALIHGTCFHYALCFLIFHMNHCHVEDSSVSTLYDKNDNLTCIAKNEMEQGSQDIWPKLQQESSWLQLSKDETVMLFDLKELENILNNMRDALRLLSFHNKRCSVSDDSMTTERSLIRFSISFLEGAFTMTESKFLTINYLQKNSFTCISCTFIQYVFSRMFH